MASEEQIARFLAGADKPQRAPKEPKQQQRRTPLARGRRPRQESEDQAVRRKRWSFIRACFLICQKRTDGYYSCQECGLKTNNSRHLDLDHIERRLPTNYVPQNAMLLCNRLSENGERSCHVRKTGTVMFSKGQESA